MHYIFLDLYAMLNENLIYEKKIPYAKYNRSVNTCHLDIFGILLDLQVNVLLYKRELRALSLSHQVTIGLIFIKKRL